MNSSLPDHFVDVMARINAINPDAEDPARYVMWSLQDEAKEAIRASLIRAGRLADMARTAKSEFADAIKAVTLSTTDSPANKE